MIGIGSKVSWKMENEQCIGTVMEVFYEPVTRSVHNTNMTCEGTKENPAYWIVSDSGEFSLRLKSEIRPETNIPEGDLDGLE